MNKPLFEKNSVVLDSKILLPDYIFNRLNWRRIYVNELDDMARDYIVKHIEETDSHDTIIFYLLNKRGSLMLVEVSTYDAEDDDVIVKIAETKDVVYL